MTNCKINYSPKAVADLDTIYHYISTELNNPIAAKSTLKAILDSIQKLDIFPNSGTDFCLPTGEQTIYKFLISNNYLTFYHLQNQDVYVDRIIYGKRDYIKLLFPLN